VKSGTPVVDDGEEEKEIGERTASPGKVQATVVVTRMESWFSTPVRTGVAGAGGEPGVTGVTQQQAFAQLLQAHVACLPPTIGAWAATTACIHTSSKLNKMADNRFTFLPYQQAPRRA